MTDLVPEARLIPVYLEELQLTAPFAQVDAGSPVYVVVRMMCAELGVGVDSQLDKLGVEYDDDAPGVLVDLRIPTGGGRQVMKCLRKAEAALWIVGITPRKVKPQFRTRLEEIRQAILLAADRIVFGDHSNTLVVSSAPARGGELDAGGCPICKTHLVHHIGPDGNWLYVRDTKE